MLFCQLWRVEKAVGCIYTHPLSQRAGELGGDNKSGKRFVELFGGFEILSEVSETLPKTVQS
jgi:hypothetical protein